MKAPRICKAGGFQEAEPAYLLALDFAPDHPEALHYLGRLLYRLSRFDNAMTTISRAIDHAPSSPLYLV